jgi:hypothetical protein
MVFAAAEAFPPTIRALGESAVHTETRREVLKPSAPARDDDAIGREVA